MVLTENIQRQYCKRLFIKITAVINGFIKEALMQRKILAGIRGDKGGG